MTNDFKVTVSGLSSNTNAASATGDSSYKNYKGWAKNQWINTDGQEFYYAESHSFINPPSNNLEKKQIEVTHINGEKPIQMWLSCGDQSVMMTEKSPGAGVWIWRLDQICSYGGQISKYLHYLQTVDSNYRGVVQMTLQPYDNHPETNGGQGYRSVLLCFGPQDYDHSSRNIIKASQLKPAKYCLNDQNFWVGGLAQYFIENTKDYADDYVLVIDQEIDEMGALSCAVAYSQGNETMLGVIDLNGKWTVCGTHRINGYKAYEKYTSWNTEAERLVCTGLLDISTGRTGSAQDPCIEVNGVTLAYPGKRNRSTVQLNGLPTVDWSGSTQSERYSTIRDNLSKGIFKRNRINFNAIKVFDTKQIGSWVDASDGIETLATGSYFDRNFIHTGDDSIKILAGGINYKNTTIWQGDAGAVIAPAPYGYVNRSIAGSQVNGVFVHRVTHRFNNNLAQDDDMGGLISNRVCFNDNYFHVSNNTASMEDLTINWLYVPSLVNSNQNDVNSISRVIVLSAINPGAGDKQRNCRLNYYQKPSNTTVIQKIQTQNIRLKDIKVSYTTSPDASSGFSTGMICAGDYQFKSLKDGFSGTINYTDANNNEFKLDCYIEKIDY